MLGVRVGPMLGVTLGTLDGTPLGTPLGTTLGTAVGTTDRRTLAPLGTGTAARQRIIRPQPPTAGTALILAGPAQADLQHCVRIII